MFLIPPATEDRKKPVHTGKPTFSHEEALRLIDENWSYQAVGDFFGISRERIRQIAKSAGRRPRRMLLEERNREIVNLIKTQKKTDAEVAKMYGVSPTNIALIRHKFNLKIEDIRAERYEPAIEAVANGMSIRAAAKSFKLNAVTLSDKCAERGIKTKFGRWGALDHREQIVRDMKTKNASWNDIREELGRVEGRSLTYAGLAMWVRKNCPDLVSKRNVG